MLRKPIHDLRAGDLLAMSVTNPDKPAEALLQHGYRLTTRVIRMLQRIGMRSVWIQHRGSDVCDRLLDENQLGLYRELASCLGLIFELSRNRQLNEQNVGELRNKVLPLIKLLRGGGLFYVCPEEIRGEPDNQVFHAVNVCIISLLLALNLAPDDQYSDIDLVQLGLGALLHEIGKTGIAPELLIKDPWDLSQWETTEIQTYPVKGFRVLKPLLGAVIANVALCHCRYLDGSGFPQEIEESGSHLPGGEKVHIFSRIVCLAKAYDDLVTNMDYLPLEAMEELNCARMDQFDSTILTVFNRTIPPFAPGSMAILNSGHGCCISGFNPRQPFRPKITLLFDHDGKPLADSQVTELDLASFPKSRIRSVAGRSVAHLLPPDPSTTWEQMN